MSDEILPIVNEEDVVIGQARRSEVRRKKLWHRGTAVLVYDSRGRVFLHKRSGMKDIYPSLWDMFVGGAVLHGESYERNAARETREELGIADPQLDFLFKFKSDDRNNPAFVAVFKTVYDGPLSLQEEEVAEGTFAAEDEIADWIKTKKFVPDSLRMWVLYLEQRNTPEV